MSHDQDVARSVTLRPIAEIAERAGIPADAVMPYGRHKAKIARAAIPRGAHRGKLVLVTGISPTPAGEGKTTTTVGLGDALNAAGRRAMIALREPSLGPCFGMKGGATGGGRAQVAPMEDINLHFTGDFHAIGSANNLLAALLDNHVYWGNALGIDARRMTWRRCVDMNDRALRHLVTGLSAGNGAPRETGFDITVASEVMAVFCLARDLDDLQARLGRIIVATRRDNSPVFASDLEASGAMAALLKDAFEPNLVQTLEGSPALIHGGPFANIAHGCNSVVATDLALDLAEIVVTEAGFGADLGAEKFIDIKCRSAGLAPSCAVLVATVRALKMHGGVARADLGPENPAAVAAGCANLMRHAENLGRFGLPVIVALNRFTADTEAEIATVRGALVPLGLEMAVCTHWSDGATGAAGLANAVLRRCDTLDAPALKPLYPPSVPLVDKIRTIATTIYRADDVTFTPAAIASLDRYTAQGFGDVPVCIAKTQYSFSTDPTRVGAPVGFDIPVREVRLSAGAGFVVAMAGDVMTMPGLPKAPASAQIAIDTQGRIDGLF